MVFWTHVMGYVAGLISVGEGISDQCIGFGTNVASWRILIADDL